MRRNHGRDSCARFCPEGFPRLHFSGLDIYPKDLHGFRGFGALSVRSYIYRLPVRRPANDVVVRFDARYGTKTAAFQRPNPPFSIRSTHCCTPAVRRDLHAGDALGSDGLGISTAQINQVIASTVPGFNSRGQQPLAIRKKTNPAVAHGVVRELPCFARSRRHEAQRSALRWFRDHPFSIGRDGTGDALANARWRRTIRIAQKHGVIRSTTIAFLFEQDLPAVLTDIAQLRPTKPPQFALLFSSRRHAPDPQARVIRHS